MRLLNISTGREEDVRLPVAALAAGTHIPIGGDRALVQPYGGDLKMVPADQLQNAVSQGYHVPTAAELNAFALREGRLDHAKYPDPGSTMVLYFEAFVITAFCVAILIEAFRRIRSLPRVVALGIGCFVSLIVVYTFVVNVVEYPEYRWKPYAISWLLSVVSATRLYREGKPTKVPAPEPAQLAARSASPTEDASRWIDKSG